MTPPALVDAAGSALAALTDPYDVPTPPVRFLRLVAKVRRNIREITPAALAALSAAARPVLIDVREFTEWRSGHAAGAVHIPRGLIEQRIERAVPGLDVAIVCYCADGGRSVLAVESLERLGYQDVRFLAGGFAAWADTGLPVAHGDESD
ncbi:MAG: rhodanese-like domain-containing protein [Opitutaceae bacterium]